MQKSLGFTLLESLVVILVLAMLLAAAEPKFIGWSRAVKISQLTIIYHEIMATNLLMQSKARLVGFEANPARIEGGSELYVVELNVGSIEVNTRSLCPVTKAKLNNKLNFFDLMVIEGDDLKTRTTNQYAAIGYELPKVLSAKSGCYVFYNSHELMCPVTIVDKDC